MENNPEIQKHRRPVPGKGHQKSRTGCHTCKQRRVKCSEEKPICSGCRRLGLDCQYFSVLRQREQLSSSLLVGAAAASAAAGRGQQEVTPTVSTSPLTTLAPTLQWEDLRFFHHFLTSARPNLPFGCGEVWEGVAAMSHDVSSQLL